MVEWVGGGGGDDVRTALPCNLLLENSILEAQRHCVCVCGGGGIF